LAGGLDGAALRAHLVRVGRRDTPEVDDARAGAPQRADARGVRLDLPESLRTHVLEALDAVRDGTLLERLEPRQLLLRQRDHELAGALDGDRVLLAEPLERRLALPAQACLERPWLVVQAGVDHA